MFRRYSQQAVAMFEVLIAVEITGVMFGFVVFGAIIVGSTTVSMLGRWETRRDIRAGRPSYLSLGDYTGTWDRMRLAELCGPPDREDCYTVESAVIRGMPKKLWLRLLDSWILDIGCVAGAIVSMGLLIFQPPGVAALLLGVCAGYQVVCWAVRIWAATRLAS